MQLQWLQSMKSAYAQMDGHAMQEVGPDGLRLVRLPASELSSIDELGRTLSQHPRVRFVVLCDPYQFSASSAAAVITALSGPSLAHCQF